MKVLTVTQVADRLGVSRQSIHDWIQEGLFPNAYRKSPRPQSTFLIPEEDVIAFERKRQQAVSAA